MSPTAADARLKAVAAPADSHAGSISRAIADMLSPLLSSSRKPSPRPSPGPTPSKSKPLVKVAAPPSYHIATDFPTALEAFTSPPRQVQVQADCPASPCTPAYPPALFCALDTASTSSVSSCGAAYPDSPGSAPSPGGAMTVFPALHKLVAAARDCALPTLSPSPDPSPEAGSVSYPSVMLALSQTVPPRMQRSNWCLADYAVTQQLYKGYASTVLKAFCRRSSELVVLKVYALSKVCDLYKYQIFREVRLHSAVQHENIVTLHAAFQEGDNVVMVEEYADGADLFSVLHKYGGRMSERLAMQLVLEPFIRVLHYLHSRGIIHRDIKPENIMFSKNMVLKLGDFGLAINLDEERAVTRAGTLDYMAPEVLQCPFKSRPDENKDNTKLCYSAGVDSWAVGVLAFELLVGWPPFYDEKRQRTEERIFTCTPAIPSGLSGEAKDFISRALSKNPLKRLSIAQMLHHPWVDGYRSSRSMRQQAPTAAELASPRPDMHSGGSSLFQPSADVAAAAAAAMAATSARQPAAAATPALPTPRQMQQQQPVVKQQLRRAPPPLVLQPQAPLPSPTSAVRAPAAMSPKESAVPGAAKAKVQAQAQAQAQAGGAEEAKVKARAGHSSSAAERLLDGKSSLKEYLQEQMMKQRQKQQQQQQPAAAAAAAAARSKAAPGPPAWSSKADGTVVMNVRNSGALKAKAPAPPAFQGIAAARNV